MNTTDWLSLSNIFLTIIISLCALFVAYAALVHTAKPNLKVKMLSPETYRSGEMVNFIFEFENIGHWYAIPPVINLVVFCNFEPTFELVELRYGSAQEISSTNVRTGKCGMNLDRKSTRLNS